MIEQSHILFYSSDFLERPQVESQLSETSSVLDWCSDQSGLAVVVSAEELEVLTHELKSQFSQCPSLVLIPIDSTIKLSAWLRHPTWSMIRLDQDYYDNLSKRRNKTASFDIHLHPSPKLQYNSSEERLRALYHKIDFYNASSNSIEWWKTFEDHNDQKLDAKLMLSLELARRNATLNEFVSCIDPEFTTELEISLMRLDSLKYNKKLKKNILPI